MPFTLVVKVFVLLLKVPITPSIVMCTVGEEPNLSDEMFFDAPKKNSRSNDK